MINYTKCPLCKSQRISLKFQYTSKPEFETDFGFSKKDYYREFWQCNSCKHMMSIMNFDHQKFYEGEYSNSTYGKEINNIFTKIINLPKSKSDNEKRFQFLKRNSDSFFGKNYKPNLLDVGSGLGIFPWRVKKEGWKIAALDPDKRNVEHIKKRLKLQCYNMDFLNLDIDEEYEIITFNKVLEHILHPQIMLEKAKKISKGFIYIEVPSVEAAKSHFEREEFFIEHLHVFSEESIKILIKNSGLNNLETKFEIEPSGKYTLRAIAVKE
tara:strand:- start:43832 stop:44635 length:804 start_codon:yes stop_codon:yes gene_type:complete